MLSHRNVKLRVFTHGIGVFVLSHTVPRYVYLHIKIRAFTQDLSCFHTRGSEYVRKISGFEGENHCLTQTLTLFNTQQGRKM